MIGCLSSKLRSLLSSKCPPTLRSPFSSINGHSLIRVLHILITAMDEAVWEVEEVAEEEEMLDDQADTLYQPYARELVAVEVKSQNSGRMMLKVKR